MDNQNKNQTPEKKEGSIWPFILFIIVVLLIIVLSVIFAVVNFLNTATSTIKGATSLGSTLKKVLKT